MVLEGHIIRQYFDKVEVSNFEVASDAFSTFKDLLSRHKPLVVSYLQTHYDEVGSCSNELRALQSLLTAARTDPSGECSSLWHTPSS